MNVRSLCIPVRVRTCAPLRVHIFGVDFDCTYPDDGHAKALGSVRTNELHAFFVCVEQDHHGPSPDDNLRTIQETPKNTFVHYVGCHPTIKKARCIYAALK